MKGFSSKRIALKVDVTLSQKIDCLQGCPCTFSPETLQAGAVKGLIQMRQEIWHCLRETNNYVLRQQIGARLREPKYRKLYYFKKAVLLLFFSFFPFFLLFLMFDTPGACDSQPVIWLAHSRNVFLIRVT